jgi:NAD(P)-dependent dehydrogenase (short-subunit alcohol dehydrogenase family)
MFSLKNKTALVTGATGLIGRQHCFALVEAGARVIAADKEGTGVEEFASRLGQGSMGLAFDVSRKNEVVAACAKATSAFGGPLDILVNNAAINEHYGDKGSALEQSRFENFPLDIFERMLQVNVTGVFLCCQVFGAGMAQAGKGSIINIASTYGLVAPDQSLYRDPEGRQRFFKSAAYPTTKSAVLGLTRYLAAYWGEAGVRVNALTPGGVINGQDPHFQRAYAARTPLGRMASPDDYKGGLVFLASDDSKYMTGANLVIDGGWTIL